MFSKNENHIGNANNLDRGMLSDTNLIAHYDNYRYEKEII